MVISTSAENCTVIIKICFLRLTLRRKACLGRVRWGLLEKKDKHWDNFDVFMTQESLSCLMSNRQKTGFVLQRIKTTVAGGLEDQTWRGRSVPWRQYLSGGGLWLRPGWHFPTFSMLIVDCFEKNKQERRFRLAVTTFPVFVKRSLWISYKPPEYIRCNLCTFSTKFPRYRNEMHVAHSLPWCYLFFTLWWNQLSFSKTDGPALRTVGYEVS